MFSPRGVLQLAHSRHEEAALKRQIHANRLAGIDGEWVTAEQAKAFCPILNIDPGIRYPVRGAALQRSGGTARHDAVAWGFARAASGLGVDIVENCEVVAIRRDATGAVSGVETTRGAIATKTLGIVVAGHSSVVAAWPGCGCRSNPIRSRPWSPSR